VQLRQAEAQGYYGNISERQFRGIYEEAIRMKGDPAHLIELLSAGWMRRFTGRSSCRPCLRRANSSITGTSR
jgi:hypothetical protein